MIHTARPDTLHHPHASLQAPAQTTTAQVSTQQASPQNTQLSVSFWGVRGSVPTPMATHQRYGGNTACVEIKMGQQHIILDGGTGLVGLGQHLQPHNEPEETPKEPIDAHLFFTHTQWDRIQGFPFFQPAFTPGNRFSIYGGTAPNGASIKHCLTDQMLKPHFSMPLQHMRAELAFHTLLPQASVTIGDVLVETILINSATQALGYRFTWRDRTLVYATDTPTQCVDLDFLKFIDQADILIYDGTYSDLSYLCGAEADEAPQPWETVLDLVKKADVKELALLHHSPVHNDDTLDQLQQTMRDRFPNTKIAYEGMVLTR